MIPNVIPNGSMTVVRLDVDSFKRLKAAHVVPSPTGLVLVRGKNAQGKSALLESMLAALLGSKATPELPIAEEAHGAEVTVDLGEIVVRRRWTRDATGRAKAALTVEARNGSRLASPQAILDNLVGRFADPVAFLTLRPDDQVRTVLGVLGLDSRLQELEERAASEYERRREVGRDADRLTKAEQALADELGALRAPADALSSSVAELSGRLAAAKDSNSALAALVQQRRTVEVAGRDAAQRSQAAADALAAAERDKASAESEWRRLTAEINARAVVDVEPIMAELQAHEERSRHAARLEIYAVAKSEARAAREVHDASTERLEAIRAEIAALLGTATFPVPGMAYDPDKKALTVNGIPFSQASQGERIRIAAAVAMAGDPPIRVLFAREGSLLDEESRMQLATLAAERGFQLWLEVVDSNPDGPGVWIEDGEAFQNPNPDGEK